MLCHGHRGGGTRKRPWLSSNNEWGQVRQHRPGGKTLLSFAESGSSYHLNARHIVSFLWGRPQPVTSGWVQRIPVSDRGTVFGLGCCGDPHIYSEYQRALQVGFVEWQPLDFVTLFVIWSAQTRFTFHALPRTKLFDSFLCNPSTAANNRYSSS